MEWGGSIAMLLLAAAPAAAQAPPAVETPLAATPPAALAAAAPVTAAGELLLRRETPVRFMVLNEVSSRTAKPGQRFALLVREPVIVDGVTLIPVNAKAWGEVQSSASSGALGKAGNLAARLLHIDVGGVQVPLQGSLGSAGPGGATQTVLGVIGLGPLGLFAQGTNAKLKAGETVTGYVAADTPMRRPG